MWYRYRGPRHRMRRLGGIPFVLPFFIFVMSHGSIGALIASFLMIMILFLIVRALMGSLFGPPMGGNYQQRGQQQQYYQPPYQSYQSYQQPYQPYQQTYQPYEQGYQPQSEVSESQQEREQGEQSYQSAQYEQYEQPQVQYPEQMPPMQ